VSAPVVGVREFRVDEPYDRDTIAYRVADRPTVIGFYSYHRWAAPPGRMLAVAMSRGLHMVDGSTAVEPVAHGRTYVALLTGRVRSIEEVDYADRQQVELVIELDLRDPDGTPRWAHVARATRSLDTNEVVDITEAMNSALGELIESVRSEFAAALAAKPD